MVIWSDVPVKIRERGKKDWGDLPVIRFNEITQKLEAVVNTRGFGYATRRDDRFRKTKEKK